MIKVLIVDDSRTSRAALRAILERDADIFIVGEAADGMQAMQLISKFDPDFVTMDVYLGHENGLDLTKTIMKEAPRPILVITGVNPTDPEVIYKAMEKGALDVFPKPPGPTHEEYAKQSAQLVRLTKILSKVPVMGQRRRRRTVHPPLFAQRLPSIPPMAKQEKSNGLILIGASTGGPPVVSGILKRLKKPTAYPVVVVQHITKGFSKGFSEWLCQATGHPTVLVSSPKILEAGNVYIPSDNNNIAFSSSKTLIPKQNGSHAGPTPNIDFLFKSAADYCQSNIIALVLTGMGSDGAEGLFKLKQIGATTVIQDPKTCVVDSMPKSALSRDPTVKSLTPDEIVTFLKKQLR